ncbi:hypothetical protein MBLNU13_g07422t1 [Cladosporium sp. NU13]
MTTPRRLLISGATGKQGGALIDALLARPSQPFELYAITRNKNSEASRLLAKQNVKLVEGNLDNVDALFAQVPSPIWGVFSVPVLDKGIKTEEKQGKDLTRASVNAGVSHIIFTSTDRGGQDESENNPTEVPHFSSKYRIEQDIKRAAAASNGQLTYTFLRPVAFFANLTDNFIGKAFISIWRLNGLHRNLHMISTKDIGKVAAEAFLNASDELYRNKGISLAGDALTPNDAARIFKEETGQEIPATYPWLAWMIRTLVPELRHMFGWFAQSGFGTDVQDVRARYPFMSDFRSWLREESDWRTKKTS